MDETTGNTLRERLRALETQSTGPVTMWSKLLTVVVLTGLYSILWLPGVWIYNYFNHGALPHWSALILGSISCLRRFLEKGPERSFRRMDLVRQLRQEDTRALKSLLGTPLFVITSFGSVVWIGLTALAIHKSLNELQFGLLWLPIVTVGIAIFALVVYYWKRAQLKCRDTSYPV